MATPIENRIKSIQKSLKVPQTGIFDMETCKAFEALQSLNVTAVSLTDHLKEIQKFLGFKGREVDALYGVSTISRIEKIFDTTVPVLPPVTSMIISKRGLERIVEWEVSGRTAYNAKYKNPIWPGGASGVTIGIGYDLGYYTPKKVAEDFKDLLQSDLNKLMGVVGLTGEKAKNAITPAIKSIIVPWEIAYKVYCTNSVPEYAKKAKGIYPEVSQLPPDAQAAVLSLVYNRGTSFTKPNAESRVEMKNLVQLIKDKNLKGMAAEFRKMKRLWTKPNQRGLVLRRDEEALMIEKATWVMDPSEYIFV
jgi:GH24 family phage-related lysozyme (muramidase)